MNTSTLFSGAVRNAFDSARRKSDETCRPSAKNGFRLSPLACARLDRRFERSPDM
jgi:hypothetical protein